MRPLRIPVLILLVALTTLPGFFLVQLLVSRGYPSVVSPINFLIAIFLISLVLLALAIPIWRYRRAVAGAKQRPKRVDPFYAVRVVLLAKATAFSGAIFMGWHIGVVLFQLSSPVVIVDSILRNSLGVLGSLLMVIAGLITEAICRLPDDPNPEPNAEAVTQ